MQRSRPAEAKATVLPARGRAQQRGQGKQQGDLPPISTHTTLLKGHHTLTQVAVA